MAICWPIVGLRMGREVGDVLVYTECFGAWLSLVERLVRDQEVRSSNLRAPTISARQSNP